MAILSSLPNPNLFSSLPTTPPPSSRHSHPQKPPIQIPPFKIQTPPKIRPFHQPRLQFPPPHLQILQTRQAGFLPITGASFEFMYRYSETPMAQPLPIQEPAFLPFAPPTMPRPWAGKAPVKKSKRNIKLFEPLGGGRGDENSNENLWSKKYEMLRAYEMGKINVRPRKEVLGRR